MAAAFLFVTFAACANVQMFHVRNCETLYFGTQKPDHTFVTDIEWTRFLEEVVTPRFPAGFTTWEANGQWRDQKGEIERERTHIVQIVDPDEAKLVEIIDIYKKQFQQEAVLRVHAHVGVAFR
jgi:hypothetical protein